MKQVLLVKSTAPLLAYNTHNILYDCPMLLRYPAICGDLIWLRRRGCGRKMLGCVITKDRDTLFRVISINLLEKEPRETSRGTSFLYNIPSSATQGN